MAKSNLPNDSLTNDNLTAEAIHLTTLYNTKPRSSSGQASFISSTSGFTYTTLGSAYDNQGQEGLLQVLQLALDNYLVTADDYNGIIDDYTSLVNNVSTHITTGASNTTKGHVELATSIETTTGTDDIKAVTPLGLKSATDLLIPLTQKGTNNGVCALNSIGLPLSKPYVIGTYTGDGSDVRTISVGFTPSAVLLFTKEGAVNGGNNYYIYGGLAVTGSSVYSGTTVLSITTNGFRVYYGGSGPYAQSNTNSQFYHYITFA